MFLLSFALSIAIYTIFLNAKLSITISLVLFGIFLAGCINPLSLRSFPPAVQRDSSLSRLLRGNNKPFRTIGKWCIRILFGNLLALSVVSVNLWRKDVEFIKMFRGVQQPQQTIVPPDKGVAEGGGFERQRFNSF
ncbi:MAG: hypothetical protein LBO09_08715 [Candidatus Peribacteria bacterium]|nr:hypothetical protein [Candidatus Peribacteria bacterium]